ncbi:MAG: pyruvate ferredoxin oxidoreductase [Candidatus Korarchaeota archaeon]|nr:pyruvate ferredoxin oxidoreductase [Candidatus Korarchaeota archaeon]NIU83459.1 pyruvate ferredoxin oxidoreductase [Candidatus Thorarchaeota archaeon]NIW13735.1 pyruvate ferredoxin oxidoreductase [Candidatus Thorarchaeota archaeon]NIW51830.1 pyruvate ferredoxin oxidoreductase [Candidatus Korarchaeota archaeon]
MTREVITGDEAAAWGARLAKPRVVAAYPITPQTVIVEQLAEWIQKEMMDSEFILVESEHSAMAATLGGSLAGARTFTATSSQGLYYMFEMISWAAGSRMPIVAAMVTRALGPPWNIWSDHLDVLSARDQGWITIWAENNQDVLDTMIQAYKIAEHEDIILPVMVQQEAMTLSHVSMPVEIPDQKDVDAFLPAYTTQPYIMNPEESEPITYGNIAMPEDYPQFRESMETAMNNAKQVIPDVAEEFREEFGRWHGGLVKRYKLDDADFAFFALGAIAEEAEAAVEELREEGIKAGAVNVRVTRPFPKREISNIADSLSKALVIDRDLSVGWGGILTGEIRATLHEQGINTPVVGKITGLGGKDITIDELKQFAKDNM